MKRHLIVKDGDVRWLYPDGSHRCVTQTDVDEMNRLRENRATIHEAAELVRTSPTRSNDVGDTRGAAFGGSRYEGNAWGAPLHNSRSTGRRRT